MQEVAAHLLFALLEGHPKYLPRLTTEDLTTIRKTYDRQIPEPKLSKRLAPMLVHNKYLEELAAPLFELVEDLLRAEDAQRTALEQEQAQVDAQKRKEAEEEADIMGIADSLKDGNSSRPKLAPIKPDEQANIPIEFNIPTKDLAEFNEEFIKPKAASLQSLREIVDGMKDPKLDGDSQRIAELKDVLKVLDEMFTEGQNTLGSYIQAHSRSNQPPPPEKTAIDSPFLNLVSSNKNRQPAGPEYS